MIFEQYAELQRQIKALQAQADALKPEVIAAMADKTHTLDDAKFTISYRKKWKHNPNVIEIYEETPVLSVKLS
jgi:hypothetical protein